ncbi:MAG: DNA replication/repair protein RecF [Pseudomonadales bacterium]|nr:DNA replication/repair protein RecF [Pseudomonadales bacterium]
MYLSRLDTHHFRNLETARLEPGSGVVLVTGANGSGKTSLLEAVWMLGTGRSFRSNRTSPVIRYGAASLTLFGELSSDSGGTTALGVRRARSGATEIKVAGERVRTASELAVRMPVQLIDPGSVELVTGGPAARRRFLDWGTFHVEPSFLAAWRSFRRSLDQRNALLRSGVTSEREFELWERQLVEAAERIDAARIRYLSALQPELSRALTELGGHGEVAMHYVRGWDAEEDYGSVLRGNRRSDHDAGYTRAGPQRADLRLVAAGRRAADVLSRGQQKILACGMLIAQARQLEAATEKTGIYLVDDLPAELDAEHRRRLGLALAAMRGQVWITSVQADLAEEGLGEARQLTMFHVEHGRVRLD